MGDVRRLLARLNPSTCRFDIGSGGVGGLTPQDVAAALGMVPDSFAREVVCAVWWPDGAALAPARLDAAVALKVREAMDRQARKAQAARLDLHIAKEAALSYRSLPDEARRDLERLEATAARLKAAQWPYDPAMHVAIRKAVLAELKAPNHCKTCNGLGEMTVAALRVVCKGCEGRGTVPVSDRSRADRIGRDEANYRRTWKDLYQFVYTIMSDAEARGVKALRDALRGDEPVAA